MWSCNFEKFVIFALTIAGIAQLVEHDLAKVGVASSSLVSRSEKRKRDLPGPFAVFGKSCSRAEALLYAGLFCDKNYFTGPHSIRILSLK